MSATLPELGEEHIGWQTVHGDTVHTDRDCESLRRAKTPSRVSERDVEILGLEPCSNCTGTNFRGLGRSGYHECMYCGERVRKLKHHLPCPETPDFE